jgi:hypothetical protein
MTHHFLVVHPSMAQHTFPSELFKVFVQFYAPCLLFNP